jgi:hypothetical protein
LYIKYQEKIAKIEEKIKNKEFDSAEQDLLQIINEEKIKNVEDDNYIHYSFYNYIETLIYWRKYRPSKRILQPENNIADVYFLLGFINFETKNYGKTIQYLDKAIEWNPISPQIRLEKADAFRNIGEIERYRVEVEKTYPYIYQSAFMAKYYRELGWYYSEKRIFDLANALYTQSISFLNTDLAKKELMYIAQQERRELRLSTKEEINKLFKEYNIPFGISNEITKIIYEDSQNLLKENNIQLANYLYRTLYDITLDKRFMLYVDLKDEKTKIMVKIPEIWKTLNKEAYRKFGISDNTLFLFLTPQNENISVVCDGKCDETQLDAAYNLNIENMKKQGATIEAEYSVRGQKNIKQVFVLVKQNEKKVRIYQNYLVINGYLINASWKVPSNVPIEKIMKIENNSFKGQFIWSLKGENEDTSSQDIMREINSRLNELLAKGMSTQEAMKLIFGNNTAFKDVKEEFNNNGITQKAISALENLSIQIIKDDTQDHYWPDVSRDIFKLLILSNLFENKEFTLPDLVEQTNNVEFVKNIITKNLDKFNIPELPKNTNVKSILNSDKQLKSIVEIIHKSILPYERTELQKQGRKEMQEKENVKSNAIMVKCPVCNTEFKLNWNVPASEKTFYCKCPNCNAEIKRENPNYKG